MERALSGAFGGITIGSRAHSFRTQSLSNLPTMGDKSHISDKYSRDSDVIAKVPRRFPFDDVQECIHEYESDFSVNHILDVAQPSLLQRFIMNSSKQPMADHPALVAQNTRGFPIVGISNTKVGRYARISNDELPATESGLYQQIHTNILAYPYAISVLGTPTQELMYRNLYMAYNTHQCDWEFNYWYPESIVKYGDGAAIHWHDIAPSATDRFDRIDTSSFASGQLDYITVFFWYDRVGTTFVNPLINDLEVSLMEKQRGFLGKIDIPVHGRGKIKGTWTVDSYNGPPLLETDQVTWTATADQITKKEYLYIAYRRGMDDNTFCTNAVPYKEHQLNCKMNIKWHTQWKELKPDLKFPYGNQTEVTANLQTGQGQSNPSPCV